MYETGDTALERILELVAKCPKELQEKCFELLMNGYVQKEVGSGPTLGTSQHSASTAQSAHTSQAPAESQIPPAVLPRFKNTAKRLSVPLEKLEALFDFNSDPFALHAVSVPGKNSAEKSRHVALLAAGRSYLSNGTWIADWQEVKSLCVDHNCYDSPNHAGNLKKGANGWFKSVDSGKPIELSSDGIKEAEKLLKALAEGAAE